MVWKLKESFILFIKGLFMGIADVIPGISGGTIAFITGIYSELIKSIKDVGDFIRDSFEKILKNKGKWKTIFLKLNFSFFIPLIIGIWCAFAVGVFFIPGLIKNYPVQVIGLFSGLVLSTSFLLINDVRSKSFFSYIWTVCGLVIGFFISQLSAMNSSSSYLVIFLAGALAVCAMILPGISGAYILLILGQYEFMLNNLRHIYSEYLYVIFFILGGFIGLLSFSKLLNFLLNKHRASTILFLVGLMIGALYGPVKNTLVSNSDKTPYFFVFLVIGVFVFLLIEFLKERSKKKS